MRENFLKGKSWLRKRFFVSLDNFLPPLSTQERAEVMLDLVRNASPGFDYFLLVVLSGSIATLGLITDSAAVIIGAMLVAPLMSPIIALGLAMVTGNSQVLRKSTSALVRGALLAIVLSFLLTKINEWLPFISLAEIPGEVLARDMIDVLRPATPGAIPPYEIDRVVGTHALLPIESGQELRWTMLG